MASKLNAMTHDLGNEDAMHIVGPARRVFIPSEAALANVNLNAAGYVDNIGTAKTAEDARAKVHHYESQTSTHGLKAEFEDMITLKG